MPHHDTARLLTALEAERTALRGLAELLEREQALLVENQVDALPELAERKSALTLQINSLTEARVTVMRKLIPTLTADTVHDWLAAHSKPALAVWEDITAMARRAQELNRVNAELLQMKWRHNQQTLTVLSNAANKPPVYGPDGQTSFTPGSGRTLGSG